MRKILVSPATTVFAAAPAAASDKTDVIADETSIIDDFPPYVWVGSGACSKWWNELNAYNEKSAETDASSTLLKPCHIQVPDGWRMWALAVAAR